jgi:hypothetical protein
MPRHRAAGCVRAAPQPTLAAMAARTRHLRCVADHGVELVALAPRPQAMRRPRPTLLRRVLTGSPARWRAAPKVTTALMATAEHEQ